ncbi:MAG: hypothetical protein PVG64_01935 [Syntrophobacterales bacterium]|jgi:hypothetical protein
MGLVWFQRGLSEPDFERKEQESEDSLSVVSCPLARHSRHGDGALSVAEKTWGGLERRGGGGGNGSALKRSCNIKAMTVF